MLNRAIKTNRALWLSLSAIFFLLQFFFCNEPANMHDPSQTSPAEGHTYAVNVMEFVKECHHDWNMFVFVGFFYSLWIFICIGLSSLLIGWLLQCVLLFIRDFAKNKH